MTLELLTTELELTTELDELRGTEELLGAEELLRTEELLATDELMGTDELLRTTLDVLDEPEPTGPQGAGCELQVDTEIQLLLFS